MFVPTVPYLQCRILNEAMLDLCSNLCTFPNFVNFAKDTNILSSMCNCHVAVQLRYYAMWADGLKC